MPPEPLDHSEEPFNKLVKNLRVVWDSGEFNSVELNECNYHSKNKRTFTVKFRPRASMRNDRSVSMLRKLHNFLSNVVPQCNIISYNYKIKLIKVLKDFHTRKILELSMIKEIQLVIESMSEGVPLKRKAKNLSARILIELKKRGISSRRESV